MENYISASEYKELADFYADAYETQLQVNAYFWAAAYTIVMYQALYPEVDLLNPCWEAYLVNLSSPQIPSGTVTAVRAINNHVITRSPWNTVDTYLAGVGIVCIEPAWAALCTAAGYVLTTTVCGGSPW